MKSYEPSYGHWDLNSGPLQEHKCCHLVGHLSSLAVVLPPDMVVLMSTKGRLASLWSFLIVL